ncbi:7-cyano-7-deazaguanine synthase [Paludisphaera borealis]|nr:7-cyano-7-deazaguanine synthase [Paludisphaera borealis]
MPEAEAPMIAVLISGGIESAVLCGEFVRSRRRVQPIYIRCGLDWEDVELAAARAYLKAIACDRLEPLVVLDEPIRDVYGPHWSTDGGVDVPGAETPDEAVYLPGRNLLLTVKSALWCRLRNVHELALGSLGSNPFSDSTPEFFQGLETVLGQALSGSPRLIRPFSRLHKSDVVARGDGLPLHLTFSCIRPDAGLHCGVCNKCAERRDGFRDANRPDRTRYADEQ